MLAVQCVQIRAVKFYNAKAALGQTITWGQCGNGSVSR